MKEVVPVLEWVVLEVIEVVEVEVEVVKVEVPVVELWAVNLSRKVRCIQWKPKEVGKGNVESCRKRSHCGDQVAVQVPLVVEVQSPVEVLGDDVDLVNKTLDLDVGIPVPREVEWKIDIQVVRDLDGVAEVVDALEVLQEKVSLAGMTTKSAAKNASG